MTFTEILYNIIIMPIQIIVEMTYSLMSGILGNKGFAIIAVSLVIQTLILPLYKRADALQEEEMAKQKAMAPYVDHIKKTFKGDERFMMVSTYYRQQNYKMWYPLKSSISILLQVPFFIAAYNYLSKLQELNGVSFAFIRDLSKMDALFSVGGFTINVLPILMTVFNLISCVIYTKGMPTKTKLQGFGLALVFLILLYNSPSGLVLYWTCNNLYSLLKNVFMKIVKHPERVVSLGGTAVCLCAGVYLSAVGSISIVRILVLIVLACVCQIPLIIKNADKLAVLIPHKILNVKFVDTSKNMNVNPDNGGVNLFTESLFMTVLTGALIPLSVISSSATEFSIDGSNPMMIVANSLTIFAGTFIVWTTVFYFLMSENIRKIFSIVYAGVCIATLIMYLAFANIHGRMSYLLRYEAGLQFSSIHNLLSFIIFLAAVMIVLWVCKKYSDKAVRFMTSLLVIITICMSVICIVDTSKVNSAMKEYYKSYEKRGREDLVTLSKKGNNVVLIMLDRTIGSYMPFFVDEKPELAEAFSGFVFYPNTLSFGKSTNFASPALFGGYEYTPDEINKRDSESLVDKHNEALKVLPKLFSDIGYNVTVCDPPYANYKWVPDLSIYDDIDNVNAYITEGAFNLYVSGNNNIAVQKSRFIYYSISKLLPTMLQQRLYRDGHYCTTIYETQTQTSDFLDCYYALDNLDVMTNISDDRSNNLFVFQNSTTHVPTILETPDYLPGDDNGNIDISNQLYTRTVDGIDLIIDDEDKLAQYHANMTALLRVAEWLQYLKDNDVYDNTRIIITSDHGYSLEQLSNCILSNGIDVEFFNPLLLYKDFSAKGKISTDNSFMTNADVPTLLVDGEIENAVNPYTGKLISNEEKYTHDQLVTMSEIWNTDVQNGNSFKTDDATWYSVHDNIFDEKNWEEIEQYSGNNDTKSE